MKSIIFVAGPPRSGTTLLAGMLNDSVETYPVFPECTYLSRIISLYHEILTYPDQTRYEAFIKDKHGLLNIFRPSVKEMIKNVVAGLPERNILVLKDPELSPLIEVLEDIVSFPLKVVACVRDPRDVMSSWVEVLRKKNEKFDFSHETARIYTYYYGLMNAEKQCDSSFMKTVRYEDIVRSIGFDELSSFSGFCVSTSNEQERVFEYNKVDPFYSNNYGKKTVSTSIGRYKKDLSRRQIRIVNKMFAGVIEKYGYGSN